MAGIKASVIRHFSHEHPLVTVIHQPAKGEKREECACCKSQFVSQETIHSCKRCSYHLHLACATLEQTIIHPFHTDHDLSLLPAGEFTCPACGKEDDGFHYNCETCGISLHTACSELPMILKHESHNHSLNLTFESPHPSNGFICRDCKRAGTNQWLYRCGECGIDVHVDCAKKGQALGNLNTLTPDAKVMMKSLGAAGLKMVAKESLSTGLDLIPTDSLPGLNLIPKDTVAKLVMNKTVQKHFKIGANTIFKQVKASNLFKKETPMSAGEEQQESLSIYTGEEHQNGIGVEGSEGEVGLDDSSPAHEVLKKMSLVKEKGKILQSKRVKVKLKVKNQQAM